MEATMFVFMWPLFIACLAQAKGMEEPCESPQYVILGETGTIQCNFTSGFFGVFWYNTTNYIDEYSLLNLKQSGVSGPGYTSREFGIHPNGSLIITEVTFEHNRTFTVVKLETVLDEVLPHFVTIIVQAFPIPPYPIIGGCHQERSCVMEVTLSGNLTCSVLGIHPRIDLEWKYPQNKTSVNLLNNRQHATRRGDGRFDVHLLSEFSINNTSEYSQTVECRVVYPPGAPDLNIVSKAFLLFPEATESPMIPGDKDDKTSKSSNGFLIFVIVLIVLVAATFISTGAFFVIRRAKRTKNSSVETGTGVAKTTDAETAPLLTVKQTRKELKEFITKLKEKYKKIYQATQPIPEIRSRNKDKKKVFIESELQLLNFREGVGKHGIWDSVESVEVVLNDPGFTSKKLILEGDHGYIKSTLGVELAYDWCSDEQSSFTKEFEVLIYLKLSRLNIKTLTFNSLIQTLLGKDMSEERIENILTSSPRVGILLDGFNYFQSGEHNNPINVENLMSNSIFKPFVVIVISPPALLESIYHFGEIRRLRVGGTDKQIQRNSITSKVILRTHASISRGIVEQEDSNSVQRGYVRTEQIGSVERGKSSKGEIDSITNVIAEEERDADEEENAAHQTEKDSVMKDTPLEVESFLVKGETTSKEKSDSAEKDNAANQEGDTYVKYPINNLLPMDILEIPLFFSALLQISKRYDTEVNHASITNFFSQMINYVEHETDERNEVESGEKGTLKKPKEQILHKIAFESFTFNKKETKFWKKEELSQKLGEKFYESCKSKGYFIEEGVECNGERDSNGTARLEIQVRFSNVFFCEWFAAHHIHHVKANVSSKKDKKEWNDLIMKLVVNDYWYCLRFLCGLSQDMLEKLLKCAKIPKGMQFFCAIEQNNGGINTLDTVKKILSKDMYITLKDSKVEQMALVQLLDTGARNEINIPHLFLEDCFNSPSSSSNELLLRSGLELPVLNTLVKLDVIEKGRTFTESEAEAIFTYGLQCKNLKRLSFQNCLLPRNVHGLGLPSDYKKTNLEVEWKTQSKFGILEFDFANLQWKKKKGKLLTDEEYDVVKEFHNSR